MRIVVLWGLLALLCQQTLVSSHILGRPSSMSDMAQLKSLLERFEDTLAQAAQEEGDYAATNQEPERSPAGRGWGLEQERDQDALILDRSQPAAEDQSQTSAVSQRNRLLDLLMTARKRTSGCFGARMDRIGNASGLGCNNGRG